MAQNTGTTAFIEASRYDSFILTNLHDGMLPDNMTRDVSNFGSGTTLNVKSVGTVTLQDVAEGTPLNYNPIDTGNLTLTISEYIGDAWSISDELRQEGSQIEQLQAARAMESTRALQEKFETDFLAACNSAQASGANLVNSFAHRFCAGSGAGTTKVMTENNLIEMALAFDKANVPAAGRIAIVDPVTAATFNKLVTLTSNVDAVKQNSLYGVWTNSFVQNHRFVMSMHGWDIFTSNRLPRLATAEATLKTFDQSVSPTGAANAGEVGDIANIFMCIADDQCRPMMRAWRKMPSTEGWRSSEDREDRFQVTAKYGFGLQRPESLGVIITDPLLTA
jgi:hypothetical protein